MVGSTAAYAMALQGTCSELVLVDLIPKLAIAQARDILHATPFAHPVRVTAGDHDDIAGYDRGLAQASRSARGDAALAARPQRSGLRERHPLRDPRAPDVILDRDEPGRHDDPVATRIAGGCRRSRDRPGHDPRHGALPCAARRAPRRVAQVDADAYVLGEHGDPEVLVWSDARAGGLPVDAFADQVGRALGDAERRARIDEGVRRAAYAIIEGKGSTYHGIGAGLARLAR